jgi:hypothetical protein
VPDHRIVSIEIIEGLGKQLSAGVTTLELEPDGERTKLRLTMQLVSLNAPDVIAGTKMGYTGENQSRELQRGSPNT